MSAHFVVRYADAHPDREPMVAFVRSIYEPVYKTVPPVADAYAAVERGGAILACMGLESCGQDGLFQIERTYGIDRKTIGLPLSADNTVQLGRWSSLDPHAGIAVVHAAVVYGIRRRKSYAFVEHSDVIHRHCRRNLGIAFHHVPHRKVNLEALPPEHRDFYARGTMKPYVVELAQMRDAVAERTKHLPIVGL